MEFFGGLHFIRPLEGILPLRFLYALQIDSGYLAHTPTGTPPKNIRENLKFGLNFSVSPDNFRASGSTFTKLFQATCREAVMIMWVQFLESLRTTIWKAKDTSEILRDF